MSGRIPTAQPVGERRNELVYTRIRRRERNFFVFSSVDIFIKRLIRKKTGQAGRQGQSSLLLLYSGQYCGDHVRK